jgi:hypothetical protein
LENHYDKYSADWRGSAQNEYFARQIYENEKLLNSNFIELFEKELVELNLQHDLEYIIQMQKSFLQEITEKHEKYSKQLQNDIELYVVFLS